MSHPSGKNDSNPPKRNTGLHPGWLNGKYSKAGLAMWLKMEDFGRAFVYSD
ncbi:MAG: hypothetical protein KDC31_09215 [Saprospiraceae bacterium]|jgi:hypothetical protein|nr:hypothetical protein [Candidatus Parvibacillus calidus]MBX2937832.1 hypothetical protein [Saprospiraceae bacterium]HNC32826.1 hypothetical protein [Bacteroidia bacterium]MBX7178997.1 hypothetical protein [Saprospiraceae bacterium]MCB0591459.1 hypothetical protein [Saprospiraceae bacterium]